MSRTVIDIVRRKNPNKDSEYEYLYDTYVDDRLSYIFGSDPYDELRAIGVIAVRVNYE